MYTVTFNNEELKDSFLETTNFTVGGLSPLLQDTRNPLTYVSIRNAAPELPDAAIIARLKCYGDVISFRPCKYRESDIENGYRTARMRLRFPIPSYIRLASESISIIYENQPRTCRRCHRTGHEACECTTYACFNCNEIGHVASLCSEPTRCSICRSIAHKAYACPYAVIDDLDSNLPISIVLAAALAVVPVVVTAQTSAAEDTNAEDDNAEDMAVDESQLTEAQDLQTSQSQPPYASNPSSSSASTILSSAIGDRF